MQPLRELQLGFARAVSEAHFAQSFSTRIRAHGLNGSRRIQVYRNNTYASLAEALAAVYPVIQRLVGSSFFSQTTRRYIQHHLSKSGDIHRYGEHFGDFLSQLPTASEYPYLADVARLEWAYHEVFHSEILSPMNLETLRHVPRTDYPSLRFQLQPAARLLASPYPVLRIWQVNQEGWRGDPSVSLDEGGVRVLVMRTIENVTFQPLGAGEYLLLEQLGQGATLAKAHERARKADSEFELDVALRRHVAQRTLVEVYLKHTA
jgi:hypothetical protein